VSRPEISIAEMTDQLRALGVARGGVLLVHMAFRRVRPVEGGPLGLIAALLAALGPDGTLVMPSWTDDDDAVFDARTTPAAADLGATAEIFRRMPGAVRSDHPFAFAALGPQAGAVVDTPLPVPPHGPDSPAGRVHALNGQVLLIGVGHDADTTLHLAEALGGVPYRFRYAVTVLAEGRPTRIEVEENDHCCQRFALADNWLRAEGRQAEGKVGHAEARLFRSRDVVAAALKRLRADPLVFLHGPGDGCDECDAARASIRR
jgi:aminoglycoside N3'-acetyltransferase